MLNDQYVVSWHDLEWGTQRRPGPAVKPVRILGYVLEESGTQRNGERVRNFVILPDPGNIFHPAHRFGDEMVAESLEQGDSVALRPRTLVWASGRLQVLSGDPAGSRPLYALEEAHVRTAFESDIRTYFK